MRSKLIVLFFLLWISSPLATSQAQKIEIIGAKFGTGIVEAGCKWQVKKILKQKRKPVTISAGGLSVPNPRGYFRDHLRIRYRVDDGDVNLLLIPKGRKVDLRAEILKHNLNPHPRDSERHEIIFNELISDSFVGGNGRYLIFRLKDSDQLAICDLAEREIVKKVDVDQYDKFTANSTHLIVARQTAQVLEQWSFKTLELEHSRPFKSKWMRSIEAGASSSGMLFIQGGPGFYVFDLEKHDYFSDPKTKKPYCAPTDSGGKLWISADGSTVLLGGDRADRMEKFRVTEDGKILYQRVGNAKRNRWQINYDGTEILGNKFPLYSVVNTEVETPDFDRRQLLVSADPNYYVALHGGGRRSTAATICNAADLRPIVTIGDLPWTHSQHEGLAKRTRVWFAPEYKVFAYVDSGFTRIQFRRLDVETELKRQGEPFVRAVSRPSPVIKAGGRFQYKVKTFASGKTTFKLSQAPEGMTIDSSGLISWDKVGTEKKYTVKVKLASSDGATSAHRFVLYPESQIKFSPISVDENLMNLEVRRRIPKDKSRPESARKTAQNAPPKTNSPKEIGKTAPPNPTKSPDDRAASSEENPLEQTVVELPGKISTIRSGAGGQFMICHIADQSKLFIIDNYQAKIVKEIPVEQDTVFAAGKTKLLILNPLSKQLQRWNLQTLQREKAVILKREKFPCIAVMGSNGEGPLALWTDGNAPMELWDIDRLEPLEFNDDLPNAVRRRIGLTVSRDGRTFCTWNSPAYQYSYQLTTVRDGFLDIRRTIEGKYSTWATPNADGSFLYYNSGLVLSKALKKVSPGIKDKELFATEDPRFLLLINPHTSTSRRDGKYQVSILNASDKKMLAEVGKFTLDNRGDSRIRARIQHEPAIRYLPAKNLIVSVTPKNKVIITKFDLKKKLAESGEKHLHVVSHPNVSLRPGDEFKYQMQSFTDASKVTYSLDSGPDGMTVSPQGQMVWNTPTTGVTGAVNVVVTAEGDNDLLATHAFELNVQSPEKFRVPSTEPGRGVVTVRKNAKSEGLATLIASAVPRNLEFETPFKFACAGGAGKYLILHFPAEGRLRTVDLTTQKVAHSIEVPDNVIFTASKDFLIVIRPTEQRLQKYDLTTLKEIASIPLPADKIPKWAVLGSHGSGPLALWRTGDIELWDIDKLESISVDGPLISATLDLGLGMTVSADGKTFAAWHHSGFKGHQLMRFRNGQIQDTLLKERERRGRNSVIPNADGSHFFTQDGEGIATDFKTSTFKLPRGHSMLPTADSRYLLILRQDFNAPLAITICSGNDFKKIVTLDRLEKQTSRDSVGDRFGPMSRFQYYNEHSLFVFLTPGNKKIEFRDCNLEKILSSAGEKKILITSRPDSFVKVGDTFEYQIDWLGDAKIRGCTLESGPAGMSVTPTGKVTWSIDRRPIGGKARATLAIENAAQEIIRHSFDLNVERILRPAKSLPAICKPEDAGYAKITDSNLEIPRAPDWITQGKNQRTLILDRKNLLVLEPDGFKIEKTVRLDRVYRKIQERDDYFVAVSAKSNSIHVIDKNDFSEIRSYRLGSSELVDFVISPVKPISYLTVKNRDELPRFSVIIFDELKNSVSGGEDWLGNHLAIDPQGKYLYTGFSDSYRRGQKLLMNPHSWQLVPRYGRVNWLIGYKLRRNGDLKFDQLNQNIRMVPNGIQISPDGQRLSVQATTRYGRATSVPGYDTEDLKANPVGYATHKRFTKMAFHPTLPMAASGGIGQPHLFDRENGSPLQNKLNLDANRSDSAEYLSAHFSGDGKYLIGVQRINDVFYLKRFELKLTPEEQKINAKGPLLKAPQMISERETKTLEYPLSAIESLGGILLKNKTKSEVAKEFKKSVVVVQSDDASGTGFFVGKTGYLLTCAHCIADDEDIKLTWVKGNGKTANLEASLVAADYERDIALLKVAGKGKFNPVHLGVGKWLETGDPVSVIGHPGIGTEILDYTMTAGIISSSRRRIENMNFIQTSAAVNPGCSGGPLFDEQGNVIGMIVLKAKIEGAGFAIGANDICKFLIKNALRDDDNSWLTRSWRKADGSEPIEAKLTHIGDEKIEVQGVSDGSKLEINIKDLSDVDQKFVEIYEEVENE